MVRVRARATVRDTARVRVRVRDGLSRGLVSVLGLTLTPP